MIDHSNAATTAARISARVAFVLLIGSSIALLIIVATTWITAWRMGLIPDAEAWQYYEKTGNGPWDHNRVMLAYVDFVFVSAAMTFVTGAATISLAARTGRRWFGALMVTLAAGIIGYHFYLVD